MCCSYLLAMAMKDSSLSHYVNSPLVRERICEVTEFKFFVVCLFSTRNVLVFSWL